MIFVRLCTVFILVATALCACVSYAPVVLRSTSAVLASPDPTGMTVDAVSIKRPYLKPEPIDLAKPLTPNALAIIAVLENPDLKALRLKRGVSEAQAFAARLLPDPTTVVGFDKLISGSDVFLAFANQLGLDISTLLKRRVVNVGARAAQQQLQLDIAWAEWQTAGAARLQAIRIEGLARQGALLKASAVSAEALYTHASHAALRGDLSSADADVRRLVAFDAADKLRLAVRDLAAARLELNRVLGLPPALPIRLAPTARPDFAPDAEVLVSHAMIERLDLQALRAGYALAENEVRKAVIDQFPNLLLTVATARDTANNYTIGPQMGFTLPLWNRNRGGIAVAKATRAQVQAEYEARLFQTQAEIHAAVGALKIVRQQREALEQAMPQSQTLATNAARAAQRGDLATANAETVQQALRDRQTILAALDQQSAELTLALELLSGTPSNKWMK